MRDFFQEQLKELNRELVKMGADCEKIIALASSALTGLNGELARNVGAIGARIDESYRTVENICLKLLLRQQPVAGDLRVISAAMKMITDMERIGDQAEDIVDLVPKMEVRPDEKYPKIREMAKAAQAMVTEAVDAYVRQDLELAHAVMKHDDIVDDYFSRVKGGYYSHHYGKSYRGRVRAGSSDDRQILRAHRRPLYQHCRMGGVLRHRGTPGLPVSKIWVKLHLGILHFPSAAAMI